MNLPRLIPSEYCFQCRECCVFVRAHSDWCAHLTTEEEILLERRIPGVSFGGTLKAVLCSDGKHRCQCLNAEDHHCRVYNERPVECALYPLLLSSENGGLKLYAHMACPYAREQRSSPAWAAHIADVRRWLSLPENASFLKAAAVAFPDYSRSHDESEFIADIPFNDGAAALLKRKAELDAWFSRRKQVLASRSFVNVFAWLDFFDVDFQEVDGNMLVFARQNGVEFLFCPPLGEVISPRAVEAAFGRMRGGTARIEAVSADEVAAFDSTRYRAHMQGEEYYYERARIASLAGNGYRSKRSDVNVFVKKHRPVFRPFEASDAKACHHLFDRWLDNRRVSFEDDIYRAMLVENRCVHRRMINHAAALGLVGRVVEVSGVLAGYTFGYALNRETFCVALEVAGPGLKGAAAFIFREFCADPVLKEFAFINAMDDFGMPGVAKAKRSWRPAFMEKIYSICLKP